MGEGEFYSCKAAREARCRIGWAKPEEATHWQRFYFIKFKRGFGV
jgi:hypothetical protein